MWRRWGGFSRGVSEESNWTRFHGIYWLIFERGFTISAVAVTELDIFSRLIDASNPNLTPDAASGILQLGYSEADHARMSELADKSNEGSITADERRELESYVFVVGDVLSLLKSKRAGYPDIPNQRSLQTILNWSCHST